MNLLGPFFLAAASVIVLPVLLHLLRRPPNRPVPFPTLRFLGSEAANDSRRHRITQWLILLIRCALIALIVLAFCRPYWPLEHTDTSRAVIVAVDNSFSMQAAGRREAVQTWLAAQLADLRPPDRVGVMLLQPVPTWLVPLGPDLDASRAAVRTLPSGFFASNYRPGLELAGAVLDASAATRKIILLAGDQQQLGWKEVAWDHPLPAGVQLITAPPAAAPRRQAAITALKAARAADGRLLLDAMVKGYAPSSDTRTVTFYAGAVQLGVQTCPVAAGKTSAVHAEFVPPHPAEAQAIRASLDPDDLTVDDTAYAVVAAADDRHILLVGAVPAGEVDYLRRALTAARGPGLTPFRVDPPPAAGAWPTAAVALVRGSAPFDEPAVRALDAFVAAGGPAWIFCDGSPQQAAWLSRHGVALAPVPTAAGELHLRDLELSHPIFTPFRKSGLSPLLAPTFARGWIITGDTTEPLARWPTHGPALVRVATDAGRFLVSGFGAGRVDSNFPLTAGYLPFLHQVVVWLADNSATAASSGLVTAPLAVSGTGSWTPRFSPVLAAPRQVESSVTPDTPGIYEFQVGSLRQLYAVNVDPAESDLTPWPTPADFSRLNSAAPPPRLGANRLAPARPAVITEDTVAEKHAWWWLLAAAAVLLLAELGLANRTVR